jgi:coatomer subunit epsilon
VVEYDTSSFSPENALPARVLVLRSRIASGDAVGVSKELSSETSTPELAAVKALADFTSGKTTEALAEAEKLSTSEGENAVVQVLAGTVLQAGGKSEEALALLGQHQGNLEAVALIVQIHLVNNRTDLATKEVQAARRWAQDSLLVNLAESWVGLRVVSDTSLYSH